MSNNTEQDINLNLLRERAKKADVITEEQFAQCNIINRDMIKEYFSCNRQLSPDSKKQYYSCLKQFFYWILQNANDKPYYNITKRDFIKFYGDMQDRGLSSDAINLRKSAVSSFCNFIENIIADEVEECKSFRNFTRGMPQLPKTHVYNKVAVTKEEYDHMMEVLEERKDYLGMAWVATAFNVGSRRSELIQFKTEILDYEMPEGKNYVLSHVVRGKGNGTQGKPLVYMINTTVLKYWKLWVDNRGYESEYIFTSKQKNRKGLEHDHLTREWANRFCQDVLSPICGRRINPHLFKASCITYLLEQGKDMKVISKYIAQHNDVSTTSNHYDLRTLDEEKDDIFNI